MENGRPGKGDPQEEADVAIEDEVKEPPSYAVLLHNDDFTTMEFVVEVLERFFGLGAEAAHAVMLAVHQEGKGIAGIYSHEIAEMKVSQVTELARSRGFPLKCTLEPVN